MPKPKTKIELLELSQSKYAKLMELVDSYSDEELQSEFPKDSMNRNVRDVFAHLHHWHLLLLGWHKVGMSGEKPDMPAKGYTWKTLPDLNIKIWEQYQNTDLKTARKLFEESYANIQKIIISHTNDDLFEKKKYAWTGSTSLAAYLILNTSSHYRWAIKRIKKSI